MKNPLKNTEPIKMAKKDWKETTDKDDKESGIIRFHRKGEPEYYPFGMSGESSDILIYYLRKTFLSS